jgi:hypothetical protein
MKSNAKRIAITELNAVDAKTFLLKNESYCNFDLPVYIEFQPLLEKLDSYLSSRNLSNSYSNIKPSKCDGVNHTIISNKDGKYAWRPLQLINPVLYVCLVHTITSQDNWQIIVELFRKFSEINNIKCLSIPVKSLSKQKDKAEQVNKWWQEIEQQSIELALDYSYVAQADITDCYGSIYTHSIAWAIDTKPVAKKRIKDTLGDKVDILLRDMSSGQTNGIPQGAVLMDLIAEIVLGYADNEISEKISLIDIFDYKILRYRDDYRVFTNSSSDAEKILKCIADALIDLGLKLNQSKTFTSDDVIISSIKPDKLAWITKKNSDGNLQKYLLNIYLHSLSFHNSGTLSQALTNYFRVLDKVKHRKIDAVPLISITSEIAYRNPRTYPIISAILSILLSIVDEKERVFLLEKVYEKFSKIPNNGYLQLWLQRIQLPFKSQMLYKELLCHIVAGTNDTGLWNIEFIADKNLIKIFKDTSVINKNKLDKLDNIVNINEVELFASNSYEAS